MTREYLVGSGWFMRCDRTGCTAQSEPFTHQPPLDEFARRGWFIATLWGDRCPEHYSTATSLPHAVMGVAR